jgi:hypothetical protein
MMEFGIVLIAGELSFPIFLSANNLDTQVPHQAHRKFVSIVIILVFTRVSTRDVGIVIVVGSKNFPLFHLVVGKKSNKEKDRKYK